MMTMLITVMTMMVMMMVVVVMMMVMLTMMMTGLAKVVSCAVEQLSLSRMLGLEGVGGVVCTGRGLREAERRGSHRGQMVKSDLKRPQKQGRRLN